jgi:hypothetical protein
METLNFTFDLSLIEKHMKECNQDMRCKNCFFSEEAESVMKVGDEILHGEGICSWDDGTYAHTIYDMKNEFCLRFKYKN